MIFFEISQLKPSSRIKSYPDGELRIQNEKDSVNGNRGKRRFPIRGRVGRGAKSGDLRKYITNFKFRKNRE